jgi:hypothetical protein
VLARRHLMMAPIRRAKVAQMRKPVASSSFHQSLSACQSDPYAFQPAGLKTRA